MKEDRLHPPWDGLGWDRDLFLPMCQEEIEAENKNKNKQNKTKVYQEANANCFKTSLLSGSMSSLIMSSHGPVVFVEIFKWLILIYNWLTLLILSVNVFPHSHYFLVSDGVEMVSSIFDSSIKRRAKRHIKFGFSVLYIYVVHIHFWLPGIFPPIVLILLQKWFYSTNIL